MEAIDGIMGFLEKWGATGLLVLVAVVLLRVIQTLDQRNQTLVDRHLEDKAKQIEEMVKHRTILDQILTLVERFGWKGPQ